MQSPSAPFQSRPNPATPAGDSLLGDSSPAAGLCCLFGFFLHILFSDQLLDLIGFHYSGDGGNFYERIHPGTYFILLSFFILLAGRGDAIHRYYVILARQTAFTVLLTLTAVLTLYMVIRSGLSVSFMIETHLTPPICAIVLCYTPLSYCRKAIDAFILVAVLNSSIGIVEAIGKFRIFHFDPGWSVMNEPQFRASALMGHPLNNAMFTSVALFVALALRIPPLIKALVVAIFLASLVAFGGRFGLAYSVSGCLAYGLIMLVSILKKGSLTLAQALLLLTAAILVPVVIVGGVFLLVNSSIGERIAAHAQWDESADVRRLSWLVFDYMKRDELIFGASPARIVDIAHRLDLTLPIKDIENPWVLMCMNLGIVMFPFWLAATVAFVWRLTRRQPLALRLAVFTYFIVASTSNSFGRKDSTYLIMVSAVMCAARVLTPPASPGRPAAEDTPAWANRPPAWG